MGKHTYYLGVYRKMDFALSHEKDLVKHYMEVHRMLKKKDYEIKKIKITGYDIYNFESILIEERKGVYLPERDFRLIEIFGNRFEEDLEDLEERLKHLASLLGMVDKKSMNQWLRVIQNLSKIRSDEKLVNKLEKLDYLNNSLIYMKMDDYVGVLSQYRYYLDKNTYDMEFS